MEGNAIEEILFWVHSSKLFRYAPDKSSGSLGDPEYLGPTAWITNFALRFPPPVITADPVGHPLYFVFNSDMREGPPVLWMAPSTPPPPANAELAALPMATVSCRVISPCTISNVD